jgi:23S rRNA (guanosine2251-2'-O)-methyltransferase
MVCGLRFPVLENQASDPPCPRCGSPTLPGSAPYGEHKPRRMDFQPGLPRVEVLLDNIRSIYNVGSIFRTSDGAGISHLHLCGITPTPDNPKLKKTALGADETIGWTHYLNGCAAAQALHSQGMRLWALEGGDRSSAIHKACFDYDEKTVVLIVGNEVCGVDPGILDQCEKILAIPMQGIKTSLNAAVAFGIAVYMLRLS